MHNKKKQQEQNVFLLFIDLIKAFVCTTWLVTVWLYSKNNVAEREQNIVMVQRLI